MPPTTGSAGLASLRDILAVLWPAPNRVDIGRAKVHPGELHYVAMPTARRATALVPLRPRRVTTAVLGAHVARSRDPRRLRRALLAGGAMLTANWLPGRLRISCPRGAGSVVGHVSDALGESLVAGVHLGPPRANRKPILHLLTTAGRTIGFAKVGIDDATRDLVRRETAALRSLGGAGLQHLEIPALMHSCQWDDTEVLVLSPLDTRQDHAVEAALLERAMVELSSVGGVSHENLMSSWYWFQLRRGLEGASAAGGPEFQTALARLESVAAEIPVGFGSWHGDWTPWNMAASRQRLVLWDWERFGSGVPVGFDALNYQLHAEIRRDYRKPRAAVHDTVAKAPQLLRPFGVSAEAAPWVAAAFLLEIGSRYLRTGQEQAGARFGDLTTWITPALTALAERLVSSYVR
ncbi:MAG: hypothetical protein ACR2KG_03165 [Nocardioidaceae bacterium]